MLQYKPTKYAKKDFDPLLTEQEHKDSCDINKMMRNLKQGRQVRGRNNIQYGSDDTNMTMLQLLSEKQDLEVELTKLSQSHEFTQKELDLIDQINPKFKKQFKLRLKKNDDQTTIPPEPQKTTQNIPPAAPAASTNSNT